MPNDKAELSKSVFACLQPGLAAQSFTFDKKRDRFVQQRGGVLDVFQLVMLDGKPGLRIQPNVGVRIDAVEALFHKVSGFEPKDQGNTVTMGNSVGIFRGGDSRNCEFLLEPGGDVAGVAKRILGVFEESALPYFQRWSSLAEIDRELNDRPTEPTRHRALAFFRCSTGIIVAKLVNRANYDELAGVYLSMMEKDNRGFYLKRFTTLLDILKSE